MVNVEEGFARLCSCNLRFGGICSRALFEKRPLFNIEQGFARLCSCNLRFGGTCSHSTVATSDLVAFALILYLKSDQWSMLKKALLGFAAATSDLVAFALVLYLKIDRWSIVRKVLQCFTVATSDLAALALILFLKTDPRGKFWRKFCEAFQLQPSIWQHLLPCSI